MLSEHWTGNHPLVRVAQERARDFDFFQLLLLIEHAERGGALLGHTGPAAQEPVRMRPHLSLGFPPGDIESAEWLDNPLELTGQLRVTTTFLGLYGSDSPLPAHFTEALLSEQDDDIRVREFIDLFHHRVFSLLFRVWKKYRYYVTFRIDGSDPISQIVRGFLGIATPHLDEQLEISAVRMFRYVGLLAQRPRSAAGLIGQLKDYFKGIDFDIEPCVGRWLWIQHADRNRLGERKCALGENFLLGERMFDRSGKFRVKVGPVNYDQYTAFLPSGKGAFELGQIVKFYCDDPYEVDIEVTLRGAEVPETPLGDQGLLGRLAWTSWLKSAPCDDKSVIFEIPKQRPAEPVGA